MNVPAADAPILVVGTTGDPATPYAWSEELASQLDDATLVNGIAQIAPFDVAAKQALLEAGDLSERAALIVQLMQFFGRHDGEERVTLQ